MAGNRGLAVCTASCDDRLEHTTAGDVPASIIAATCSFNPQLPLSAVGLPAFAYSASTAERGSNMLTKRRQDKAVQSYQRNVRIVLLQAVAGVRMHQGQLIHMCCSQGVCCTQCFDSNVGAQKWRQMAGARSPRTDSLWMGTTTRLSTVSRSSTASPPPLDSEQGLPDYTCHCGAARATNTDPLLSVTSEGNIGSNCPDSKNDDHTEVHKKSCTVDNYLPLRYPIDL
jgi:hypothetical protein